MTLPTRKGGKRKTQKTPPRPSDPTRKNQTLLKFVTPPKIVREPNRWYQMIGIVEETNKFYNSSKLEGNVVAKSVGELMKNAIKFF